VLSENTADAVEVLHGKFSPGLLDDYASWRDFLVNYRFDGASAFTLAYWDWQQRTSKATKVRWAGGDLVCELPGNRSPLTLCNFDVNVFVVTEDSYVLT
jgi:hypothetical protein